MAKKAVHQESRYSNLRPPVVAVLGHVDHGKTTLLDKIRQTQVAEKEPGLITQRIGAYQVEVEVGKEKRKITFLDTPGHEIFVKMRQRGAQITDLAILVVAADDGVMPQTKESIKHLKETNTRFIVALNKIDLPTANPSKVKQQLAEAGVLTEELGGQVVCLPISARTGAGIKELLEMIILLSEMEGLSADPQGQLKLAVVESKLDSRKGPVATVIVQSGTVRVGQTVQLGGQIFKVRGMIDDCGRPLKEAGPSTPVEILGLRETLSVGEATPKESAGEEGTKDLVIPKLKVILKADVSGSLEAILHSLPEQIEVLSAGVGEITGSEVLLAKTTGAVVLGFNLNPSAQVQKLAETERVLVKTYQIIYELLQELEEVSLAQMNPQSENEILGKAKIIAEFPYNDGKIAGCQIVEGRLCRGDLVKIVRGETEMGETKIKSIRRQKEDVSKVETGLECGVLLSPPLDFQPGDMLLSYKFLRKSI